MRQTNCLLLPWCIALLLGIQLLRLVRTPSPLVLKRVRQMGWLSVYKPMLQMLNWPTKDPWSPTITHDCFIVLLSRWPVFLFLICVSIYS